MKIKYGYYIDFDDIYYKQDIIKYIMINCEFILLKHMSKSIYKIYFGNSLISHFYKTHVREQITHNIFI